MVRVNLQQLRHRCLAGYRDFDKDAEWNPDLRYWFKDNGGSVLAVAHLDTVNPHMRHFKVVKLAGEINVFNAQLDDRLGAYIILDLLPSLGLKYDILLTLDEEAVRSTAEDFVTKKQYNWSFMFDRAGQDVVMYQYSDKDLKAKLHESGFVIGTGTYSCIRDLEIGAKGMNFGTGYYDQHTHRHFCLPWAVEAQVSRFIKFWDKWSNIAMPHDDRIITSQEAWWKANTLGKTTFKSKSEIGKGAYASVPRNHKWEEDCEWCGQIESMCQCLLCVPAMNDMCCSECGITIKAGNQIMYCEGIYLCNECSYLLGLDKEYAEVTNADG